ncbi:conserved hypothetical protein [Stigmatella aurantiaca DW4/3-1]|uniref:Uncharacterized protein n=1 Tax=Stigmatella aurantiaca (strain DW4/3-1) TaxID=378806 RepID=Q09BQ9_STIAD|nr:conserved hypothetical protein [Stigmatella aurantiaca DW4/3-1]
MARVPKQRVGRRNQRQGGASERFHGEIGAESHPEPRREPPQPPEGSREKSKDHGHRGAQRQGLGNRKGNEAVPFGHWQGEHVKRAACVARPPEHEHAQGRDEERQQKQRVEQDVEHARTRLGAHRHQRDHQQEEPQHGRLPIQEDGGRDGRRGCGHRRAGGDGGRPGGGGLLVLERLAQRLERLRKGVLGEVRGGLIRQRVGEAEGTAHTSLSIRLQRGCLQGGAQRAGLGARLQHRPHQQGLAHHLQRHAHHLSLEPAASAGDAAQVNPLLHRVERHQQGFCPQARVVLKGGQPRAGQHAAHQAMRPPDLIQCPHERTAVPKALALPLAREGLLQLSSRADQQVAPIERHVRSLGLHRRGHSAQLGERIAFRLEVGGEPTPVEVPPDDAEPQGHGERIHVLGRVDPRLRVKVLRLLRELVLGLPREAEVQLGRLHEQQFVGVRREVGKQRRILGNEPCPEPPQPQALQIAEVIRGPGSNGQQHGEHQQLLHGLRLPGR